VGSFGKQTIPFAKGFTQVAPAGLQLTKSDFESHQLLGRELADSMTGGGSTIAFTKDIG
jgi:hypothetical protein